MPKRVDHDERRRQISEALWRIAATRGLDGASLRDVAAEAGISLGRLQHYFTSKDEMFVFALEYISGLGEQRIRERVQALPGAPAPRDILRHCLLEMLPLDDESRAGNLVQVAYFARAVHDERMRRHAQEGVPALRDFFAAQVRHAVERGEVSPERDPQDEAMLLIGLADGLTSFALLDVYAPAEALRLIDRHLAGLFSYNSSPRSNGYNSSPRSSGSKRS
ncbi:TetR/AcrR family transcriptional regulator [Streptomyces sp. NPDC050617]|uniref:TetR/AcrR family transcriptional regulator n=1 Tax=Streptomyces sp. NPDC050617 TaxID=3154628 RepID=UPI00342E4183